MKSERDDFEYEVKYCPGALCRKKPMRERTKIPLDNKGCQECLKTFCECGSPFIPRKYKGAYSMQCQKCHRKAQEQKERNTRKTAGTL